MPIQPLEKRGHIGEKNLPKPPTTKLPNHPTPLPLFLVLSVQRLLMLVLSPSWQRLTLVQMGEKPPEVPESLNKETLGNNRTNYHQSGCWYLWITYKGWWKNHYMDANKHRLCWSQTSKQTSQKMRFPLPKTTTVPSRRLTNIPPNGKFGKSLTQKCHFLGKKC